MLLQLQYDAAKITQNTIELMQKYRKNYLEMIAPTLLKAVFNFLNTKSRRLNVLLL